MLLFRQGYIYINHIVESKETDLDRNRQDPLPKQQGKKQGFNSSAQKVYENVSNTSLTHRSIKGKGGKAPSDPQ